MAYFPIFVEKQSDEIFIGFRFNFFGARLHFKGKNELMIFKIMDKDKIFMVTIHVVAGVLMTAVCWTPAIVGDISVWNKLFCTAAIILLLRFHYWCQQYEP